jgi:4a-hydroxytetrahydrobiopterin dehydratase
MEIENWNNTGEELVREFTFENQTELAEFILIVARFSDEVNHHADMHVSKCRKLRLSITTHDKDGLTELDYKWAIGLNILYKA